MVEPTPPPSPLIAPLALPTLLHPARAARHRQSDKRLALVAPVVREPSKGMIPALSLFTNYNNHHLYFILSHFNFIHYHHRN